MDIDIDPEIRDREMDEGLRDLIYLKYVAEGLDTIQEVVGALRQIADDLAEKVDEGFVLEHPVDTGFVSIVKQS